MVTHVEAILVARVIVRVAARVVARVAARVEAHVVAREASRETSRGGPCGNPPGYPTSSPRDSPRGSPRDRPRGISRYVLWDGSRVGAHVGALVLHGSPRGSHETKWGPAWVPTESHKPIAGIRVGTHRWLERSRQA